MGLFKIIAVPIAMLGSATYCAFSLGPKRLPIASRNAGRAMGMGYNYFKLTLRFFTPEAEQANQIVNQYRKGSQQAHAFTREFKASLLTQRAQLQKIVPELGKDPLEEFKEILNDPLGEQREEAERPASTKAPQKDQSGSRMLLDMERERRALIEKKYVKRTQEE